MFKGVMFEVHELPSNKLSTNPNHMHRGFQTRASPGIARVKFWSIVLIAYQCIVLRDDGTEFSDGKTV